MAEQAPLLSPEFEEEQYTEPPEPPVQLRKFDDIDSQRNQIYDQAKAGVAARFPLENTSHRLEVSNLDYVDYNPSKTDEKNAILSRGRLQRPLKGTISLYDKATNQLLDQKNTIVAHVPHLNSRGLFVHDGTIWNVRNQSRLRPGVYTRRQQNGSTEAHFNIKPGTGRGFRIQLEPETGTYKFVVGQSSTKLYPVLKALGISDDQMKEAWGKAMFNQNWRESSGYDSRDIKKIVAKLGRSSEMPKEDTDQNYADVLKTIIGRSEVDPITSSITLSHPHTTLSPEILLNTTRKVLRVSRGEHPGDNRDSQAFQSVHSAEDLFRERLERDATGAARIGLWKATKAGNLSKLGPGWLTPNIHSLFQGSGLAATPEDINPLEIYDLRQAITRMGEGGIASSRGVSRDARGIQPSYFGIIDGSRAPESDKIGLDLRVTDSAMKGSDGQLYTSMRNKAGQIEPVSARQMVGKTLTFPGEMARGTPRVRAFVDGDIKYVDRESVDYELPHGSDMFSRMSNMIPMAEAVKSGRLLMGARMSTQALPLKNPEAPLVAPATPDGRSMYEEMGKHVGAIHSEQHGVVTHVSPDEIHVQHAEGTKVHSLFNNYPSARKTLVHNETVVKPGDNVQPGQLLAKSNYTDKKGHAAPGLNMRVAYLAGKGSTYEDAVVISEAAAKRLSSEHMYKHTLPLDGVHSTKTADYKQIYADKYKPEQYEKLDEDGIIKVGQRVSPGDPVVVAVGSRMGRVHGAVMASQKSNHTDLSQTWDHPQDGIVTDVAKTRSGIRVAVKSYEPMTVGSKMSGLYGNKGVVSRIIPDIQMPHDKEGKPVEVLLSPLGIITRVNPAALAHTLLGKVADKTGKKYAMPVFGTKRLADFALNEAKYHGIPETEDLIDPETGRTLPGIFTGHQYMLKLHHTAEGKLSARDTGTYSLDDSPARGGPEGSKRIGTLDLHSLLSYGATKFLKDAKLVRGQKNEEFWQRLKLGETPTYPSKSLANEQFKSMLQSAGIAIREKPDQRLQVGFLTDRDIDGMAQHEITNGQTFDFDTLKPIKDGLFDLGKTGGADGNRFTKFNLPAKIPNPLAEESITRILGLTGKRFESILGGKEELYGKKGPEAIESALQGMNLEREIDLAKNEVRTASKSKRDDAVRKLGFLSGIKEQGLKPSDLMLSKFPVLPPKYRPVVRGRGMDVIHDANYLYHDLMEASKNYTEHKNTFNEAADPYITMYHAAKAVSGLSDPVNPAHVEQGVKGMLRFAIGVKDSPKFSRYHRKVLGNSVDTVGRGVVTIDPDINIDQLGVPEDMAWTLFRPWVIRRMIREGTPATEALKSVRDRHPAAERHLLEEMKERPVVYNRAPSLHRYNYLGAFAKLNKGRSDISTGQPVTKGLGLDYDGDNMNVHVPVSDEAVKEVIEKMMPSKNLYHTNSFDVHLEPTQDYLAGLYLASQANEKPVRHFNSMAEAKEAFKRGEISARDRIDIK